MQARVVLESQDAPGKLNYTRLNLYSAVTCQLQYVDCVGARNTDNLILVVTGHCPALLLRILLVLAALLQFLRQPALLVSFLDPHLTNVVLVLIPYLLTIFTIALRFTFGEVDRFDPASI